MRKNTIKAWFLVHQWSSLVSTLFLLMLCLTGLPLIFAHDIDHWLGNAVELPTKADNPVTLNYPVDAIINDARTRYPTDSVQFLVGDPEEARLLSVRLGPDIVTPDISAYLTYDTRDAELLQRYPLDAGFINLMLRLHVDMFMGLPGTLFLGLMGLLLAISLVSGVVLYAPFMRKLPFGIVRNQHSARLRWLDLHNLLGIATLVWLMVVGVTGVINTLSIPIFSHWQAQELGQITSAHGSSAQVSVSAMVPVDNVLQTAQTAIPEGTLNFMAFPGNPFATPQHFTVFMNGNTPLTANLLSVAVVDAMTGELTDVREMPWYVQTLMLSQPLHFGDYGGLPLKVLWTLFDLIAIIILGSGVYLWIVRRRFSFEYADTNTARAS
ncbi:MAG: PepSY-associated TM helix domain-containing protein [Pseudomonadota bacterium]